MDTNSDPVNELRELIYNLLDDYERAEASVIYEYSGSINNNLQGLESDVASIKENADQLLDRINGRLIEGVERTVIRNGDNMRTIGENARIVSGRKPV